MLLYRFLLVLGVSELAFAAQVSSTYRPTATTVTPTTTYCPRFHPTPIVPSPTSRVCGGAGTQSNPKLLAAYCGYGVRGLGLDADVYEQCYRACAAMPQCQSFSVDNANIVCYIYGKTLQEQGFVRNTSRYEFFWDMRGCHKCTLPKPAATSECPSKPTPKSPLPQGYSCGAKGRLLDKSRAVYNAYAGPGGAEYTPDFCYNVCADYYEPLGQCQSYAENMSTEFGSSDCYIFNSSLIDAGFQGTSDGGFKGWNLKGCFNCNLPTKTAEACQPTSTPYDVGVRNGNFQRTYIDQKTKTLQAYDWRGYYDNATIQVSNGNVFVSMSCNQTSEYPGFYSNLAQTAYGFDVNPSSPNRFYNISFDLAIPYNFNSLPKKNLTGCFLRIPGPYDAPVIPANSTKFQGSTFKQYGPYLVDASRDNIDIGYTSFWADCYAMKDSSYFAKAIFYIDNFRITRNGKDVGKS